jgi:DNA-binding transcriptional regulator of glucitol operon
MIMCCGLAYWQWRRFESASGTFQNLGYVLQWPLFGLFPAFMFWRIRRYVRENPTVVDSEATSDVFAAAPVQLPKTSRLAYVAPVRAEDSAEDLGLADYNRYLATLSSQED